MAICDYYSSHQNGRGYCSNFGRMVNISYCYDCCDRTVENKQELKRTVEINRCGIDYNEGWDD